MSKQSRQRPRPVVLTAERLDQILAANSARTADMVIKGITSFATAEMHRQEREAKLGIQHEPVDFARNDPRPQFAVQYEASGADSAHVPPHVIEARRQERAAQAARAGMNGHGRVGGGVAGLGKPLPPPGSAPTPTMPRVVDAHENLARVISMIEELPGMFNAVLGGLLPVDFHLPELTSTPMPTSSPQVMQLYGLAPRVENVYTTLKIILNAVTV